MLMTTSVVVLAVLIAPSRASWTVVHQALGVGDVIEQGDYTLASAKERCIAQSECVGFTIMANTSSPAGPVPTYLKNATNLIGGNNRWWTYLRPKATFRFANSLGDHMVLQQAPMKARLWGYATPGATVSVSSSARGSASTTADADGLWAVSMPPVKASMTPTTLTASSSTDANPIHLHDVLYGDVWFCSGQSNMAFTVDSAFNATLAVKATAHYPHIRIFTVGAATSNTTLTELLAVAQTWAVASPRSVGRGANFPRRQWARYIHPARLWWWTHFSAACWFYGRDLADARGVPIGLIASAWSGTRVDAWMDAAALATCNASAASLDAVQADGPTPSVFGMFSPDEMRANFASAVWNAMVYPFLRTTVTPTIQNTHAPQDHTTRLEPKRLLQRVLIPEPSECVQSA